MNSVCQTDQSRVTRLGEAGTGCRVHPFGETWYGVPGSPVR